MASCTGMRACISGALAHHHALVLWQMFSGRQRVQHHLVLPYFCEHFRPKAKPCVTAISLTSQAGSTSCIYYDWTCAQHLVSHASVPTHISRMSLLIAGQGCRQI